LIRLTAPFIDSIDIFCDDSGLPGGYCRKEGTRKIVNFLMVTEMSATRKPCSGFLVQKTEIRDFVERFVLEEPL
jgi:hypothetical protein